MELAQLIGLNQKRQQKVFKCLLMPVKSLCHKVGLASNFESQGIDKKEWDAAIHRMAMNAYEDQCTPANPRMPMVHDMEAILRTTWDYKNKFDK